MVEISADALECMAATDFFTVEVFTARGLVTHYVLFFIDIASRAVKIAGVTRHPGSRKTNGGFQGVNIRLRAAVVGRQRQLAAVREVAVWSLDPVLPLGIATIRKSAEFRAEMEGPSSLQLAGQPLTQSFEHLGQF